MPRTPLPEARRTLGALLRHAYEALAEEVYGALPARGFPEIRRAHGAVFRHLPPAGARLTELAIAAGMAKQSMAYLVEDLARLGHVESRPDPEDGRARRILYTARGRRLLELLLRLSAEAELRLAARIGIEEAATLRRALERLAPA
ncbi:MarR family winged helix-turn-helix transcriptional regulator [Roseococcus sp. SDR]|uniref:MarR family winged helix-turn-helix transcriptional regulator n=1 Tax=Roseococcus sp. SDR TaxID=2835532 RepID=UPI001BCDA9DD|nr:MarR family winged helix-turn-helix transcriptional regulator [Roseococcus sp. SDR]MBS7788879.1 winged helix-turn-helix transcriptional regulator [Roseococcus sp. SDR]MBV1844193.1 MarR family winged helix-turn-helix transcriptional regulator [Roseococcus sp. SDR]